MHTMEKNGTEGKFSTVETKNVIFDLSPFFGLRIILLEYQRVLLFSIFWYRKCYQLLSSPDQQVQSDAKGE